MIRSFKHAGLEKFFRTGSKAGIQPAHATKLLSQLSLLDAVTKVESMDLPGWDLHPLKGSLRGQWSIKVNGNWRVTFRFSNGEAEIVDYQDYH